MFEGTKYLQLVLHVGGDYYIILYVGIFFVWR